jgi:hypothetical protein
VPLDPARLAWPERSSFRPAPSEPLARLAYESARTVAGDRGWPDIGAQLARIAEMDRGLPRRHITILGAGVPGWPRRWSWRSSATR